MCTGKHSSEKEAQEQRNFYRYRKSNTREHKARLSWAQAGTVIPVPHLPSFLLPSPGNVRRK